MAMVNSFWLTEYSQPFPPPDWYSSLQTAHSRLQHPFIKDVLLRVPSFAGLVKGIQLLEQVSSVIALPPLKI